MDFVLIHGSWHDGTCWDGVAGHLQASGHTVLAPTLPGSGDAVRPEVTMDETVDAVVAAIAEADLSDAVLVGHSFGGVVVQKVAEVVPQRLRRLVFHNAYVLADGETVFDHIPEESAAAFQALAEAAGDGTVPLPFEVFHAGFMNDVSEESARAVHRKLSPEPLARAAEPVRLQTFGDLGLPTSYLYATDDAVFPPPFSWHPGQSQRLGPDARIVTMAGSHEVLFSDPGALAEKLIEAAAD